MKNSAVKLIAKNAVVAAIYFCLTMISSPISFGPFQVRIAEALVLLCFFNRDYIFGITLGCMLSNVVGSSFSAFDVLFGTIATLLSCVGVSLFKHLFLSTIIPVALNGVIVGLELYYLGGFDIPVIGLIGLVAIGEFIAVSVVGYLLVIGLRKNKQFFEIIGARKNNDFKW